MRLWMCFEPDCSGCRQRSMGIAGHRGAHSPLFLAKHRFVFLRPRFPIPFPLPSPTGRRNNAQPKRPPDKSTHEKELPGMRLADSQVHPPTLFRMNPILRRVLQSTIRTNRSLTDEPLVPNREVRAPCLGSEGWRLSSEQGGTGGAGGS